MISWSQFFKTQSDEFFQNLNFEINKVRIGEFETRICIHEDFYKIQEDHCEIFECENKDIKCKVRNTLVNYQKDLLQVRIKAFEISSKLGINSQIFDEIRNNCFGLLHTLVALPTHFDNPRLWNNFPSEFKKDIEITPHSKISSEGRILASNKYRSLEKVEVDKFNVESWDPIVNGIRRGHDYFFLCQMFGEFWKV